MSKDSSKEAGGRPVRPDFRHVYRVLIVLGILGVLALVARQLVVPKTYGRYGHFRGGAVGDAMKRKPRHVGEAGCAVKCHPPPKRDHAKIVKLHDKDAHARVECEVCHGPGGGHVEAPKKNPMAVPKGKGACLVCHRRLSARPAEFAQIEWKEHYKFVGVKDESVECKACHSPHEPLYMDRDLRKARLHPVVHRCRDCHTGRVNEKLKRPVNHPKIFECRYCHKALVDDLPKRPHKKLRCTTCHVFFKETAFAGRIIRDTDPRFCLLCHRKTPFRSKNAAPGIVWDAKAKKKHVDDLTMKCTECHQEKIHAPDLIKGPGKALATPKENAPVKTGEEEKAPEKKTPEKKPPEKKPPDKKVPARNAPEKKPVEKKAGK